MSTDYEHTQARTGDPDTSYEAAERVVSITATRRAILNLLEVHGPMTDEDIARLYDGPRSSPSGLRTRRSELVRAGRVVDTGHRARLSTGRHGIVWASTADMRLF